MLLHNVTSTVFPLLGSNRKWFYIGFSVFDWNHANWESRFFYIIIQRLYTNTGVCCFYKNGVRGSLLYEP